MGVAKPLGDGNAAKDKTCRILDQLTFTTSVERFIGTNLRSRRQG